MTLLLLNKLWKKKKKINKNLQWDLLLLDWGFRKLFSFSSHLLFFSTYPILLNCSYKSIHQSSTTIPGIGIMDSLIIFSWSASLRWLWLVRLHKAHVAHLLVQSIFMLHWNINSVFWCGFACKATMASLSTKGVTFILQSVLKEAWNISENGWQRIGVSFSLLTFIDGRKHGFFFFFNCYAWLHATHILEAWKLLTPECHHEHVFPFFAAFSV